MLTRDTLQYRKFTDTIVAKDTKELKSEPQWTPIENERELANGILYCREKPKAQLRKITFLEKTRSKLTRSNAKTSYYFRFFFGLMSRGMLGLFFKLRLRSQTVSN